MNNQQAKPRQEEKKKNPTHIHILARIKRQEKKMKQNNKNKKKQRMIRSALAGERQVHLERLLVHWVTGHRYLNYISPVMSISPPRNDNIERQTDPGQKGESISDERSS